MRQASEPGNGDLISVQDLDSRSVAGLPPDASSTVAFCVHRSPRRLPLIGALPGPAEHRIEPAPATRPISSKPRFRVRAVATDIAVPGEADLIKRHMPSRDFRFVVQVPVARATGIVFPIPPVARADDGPIKAGRDVTPASPPLGTAPSPAPHILAYESSIDAVEPAASPTEPVAAAQPDPAPSAAVLSALPAAAPDFARLPGEGNAAVSPPPGSQHEPSTPIEVGSEPPPPPVAESEAVAPERIAVAVPAERPPRPRPAWADGAALPDTPASHSTPQRVAALAILIDDVRLSPEPVLQHSERAALDPRIGFWLRRAGWLLFAGASGYGVLCLALIGIYRYADPPYSTLTLARTLAAAPVRQAWVPLSAISPNLVRAVVISEDGQFCRHKGVDWGAIKEAREQAQDGILRGASTITMQVMKNLFLWPQKSYVRKAVEIPLALISDRVWSKSRTLEIYLNIAEWGPGLFGAEAAAQYYFSKPASRLSEQEAVFMAVALPNPIARNPVRPGRVAGRLASRLTGRVHAIGSALTGCVDAAGARPLAAAKASAKSLAIEDKAAYKARGFEPRRVRQRPPADSDVE